MARLTGSEPIRWGRTRSSAVFARLERSLRMNGYVDLAGKPLPDAATTGTSISITPSVASIPLGAADAVLVVPPTTRTSTGSRLRSPTGLASAPSSASKDSKATSSSTDGPPIGEPW
jgi:hypothetical protein